MTKRSVVLTASLTAGLCFLLLRQSATQAQITNPQPAPPAGELQSITLIFGSKDMAAAKWDGSVSLSAGKIEKLTGYHFTRDCKILEGNAWECGTHPWPGFSAGMHPNEKPQPRPTMVEPVGVTIDFRAPGDAEIHVKVPKGEFSFHPTDVPEVEGIFPLGAVVEIYRTPVVEQVTDSEYEDDYPALASEGDNLWLAWQGYKNESDQVFLRRYAGGKWGERVTVSDKPADIFMSGVSAARGSATVVWSERDGGNWRLKSRVFGAAGLGATETLTNSDGGNLFHRVTTDSKGNAHVVYQSWRRGRSDIYLRSSARGKWQNEIKLSDSPANDWNPAVAVDRGGTVWVAWDSYDTGSYNIFLRPVRNGKPGELLKVTNSTRFHAHPSLAVDLQDRLWIAYDEAPENWGKDTGFLFSGGTGLYDSRTIKVAVYAAGKWMTPLRQPGDVVPYGFRRFFQTPRLVADSKGRIWLFSRPRSSARLPTTLWAAGGKWEVYGTVYSGDRWSDLLLIPETVGRNEGEMQAAADRAGNVYVALVSDHRLWGGPTFGEPPRNNDIMFTRLTASQTAPPELGARPPEPPGGKPNEPREREQIARLRQYTITSGGVNYKIYRGDMHRHTDISADGAGDGSLWDAYRYMMDAADMDYFVLTDHQSGDQEYTWWRTQKASDMFHVPGTFTALFGTERSLQFPNGHRNLVFAKRGVHILPITPAEQKSSTGPVLFPFLKKHDGISMPHTSATGAGTDWRDNDPAVEPLVEIFQGARISSEHEGAPLAANGKRSELWASGYKPQGYLWNAWAKGYRLGVQASSDHVSNHLSYGCIISKDSSREGLLDAMKRRHAYAATSNILMDYRMQAGPTAAIQGDDIAADALPEISAKIVGTGPLKKVVIIRDNQYIYSNEPEGETFDLRYRENSLQPGQHYYYVRAEQKDGNVAWSSPIWVKYRSER